MEMSPERVLAMSLSLWNIENTSGVRGFLKFEPDLFERYAGYLKNTTTCERE